MKASEAAINGLKAAINNYETIQLKCMENHAAQLKGLLAMVESLQLTEE